MGAQPMTARATRTTSPGSRGNRTRSRARPGRASRLGRPIRPTTTPAGPRLAAAPVVRAAEVSSPPWSPRASHRLSGLCGCVTRGRIPPGRGRVAWRGSGRSPGGCGSRGLGRRRRLAVRGRSGGGCRLGQRRLDAACGFGMVTPALAWYSGPCLRGSAYSFGLIVQYVPDVVPYHDAPPQSGSNGSLSASSYDVDPSVARRRRALRVDSPGDWVPPGRPGTPAACRPRTPRRRAIGTWAPARGVGRTRPASPAAVRPPSRVARWWVCVPRTSRPARPSGVARRPSRLRDRRSARTPIGSRGSAGARLRRPRPDGWPSRAVDTRV